MKRAQWFLIIVGAGAIVTGAAALSYKRWPRLLNRPVQEKQTPSSDSVQTLSVAPFSTKEPERYQATRVITNVETSVGGPQTVTTKILIARDGDKRREEYDAGTEAAMVYLEIPSGRFALLPSKKLYADLNLAASDPRAETNSDVDTSAESLLYETRAEGRYEKLGAETVNARTTIKYRVTIMDPADGTKAASETLLWIDDQLGMPIKSETISLGADRASKSTAELSDIRLEVSPSLFELPKDYQRVDYQQLRTERARPGNAKNAGH